VTTSRDLFANFERMRREIDELFGDVFERSTGLRGRGFSPSVDVYYEDDPPRAVVRAELAGVEPQEILAPVPVAGLNHCAGISELRLRDGRDAMPLVRARAEEPVVRWVIDTFGMIPYCWAHWVEFFPQLQRLEEPYAGRAQGLAMSFGRRIYVMDNERGRAKVWNDLAERWSSRSTTARSPG